MKDPIGVHTRLRECPVAAALRRIVPGEYRTVTECEHPLLLASGFSFESAAVITKELSHSIPGLFLMESLPEKLDPAATAMRNKGEWVFVMDKHGGAGASALWLLTVVDFPDRFMKAMPEMSKASAVMMRPTTRGWLVGVQATFLKHILKIDGRRDSQFS